MAVRRVIDRLLNNTVDVDAKVNAWIDSGEVNIRENNGQDNVIDFLLPLQPNYSFTSIDDKSNPTPEVESYVKSSMPKDGEVVKKIKELKDKVEPELLKLIKKEINEECGVATCERLLDGIEKQVDLFLGEMQDEVKDLKEDKLPKMQASLELAKKDLVELDGKFFKKKSDLEELANNVIATTTNLVMYERDIIRHNAAISFYNSLKVELSNMKNKVDGVKKLLLAVSEDMKKDIVSLQNYVGKESQTFQIDLAKDEFLKLTVNDNEILITDLLAVLPSGDKIYDFANKNKNEVTALLLKYTHQLRSAKELGDRTIDEMLDKLSDTDFEHLIRTAINKSAPLLKFDYKGYTPLEIPAQSYYIGVPDKKNSRLCKDDAFKNMLQGNIDVDFSNIGVRDRVIVYRQVGVYPAYCIAPLSSYKEKYDNCNCFCHIDANIYKKMQREDYNLYPKVASDDSLELWVKGFIFNLIKNENDMYYFRSEEHGDALDDNWFELSKYRDDAFDKFKQYKNSIRKEFNEYFAKYQKTKGVDNMQELIDKAKENYFDVYSQIQLTKEEVKQRGNEAIRKLITQELDFVKKEL